MRGIITNKRVAAIIYAVMIMLVTTTVAIGVYDFNIKTGTLTIEGKSEEVKTKKITVGELLKEKEITLGHEDYINVSEESEIENEFDIVIRRAVPVVLNFKDKEVNIQTTESTVKDVLNSLSIFHDEDDKITPELNAKVVKDMTITVVEFEEKSKTIDEEIAFEVETSNNGKLEKGKSLVVQEGIKGLRQNKVKETYENGKLITTEVEETKLVREPVKQIVQVGTKVAQAPVASRGVESQAVQQAVKSTQAVQTSSSAPVASLESAKSIVMNASAYDLSYASTGKNPGDKYYGITASGTKARPGVVAVDPKVIPLGTKLYIESMDGTGSYGYASAEDKGGAIKGNRIDLFYANRADALQFGRRQVKVYILD